MTDVVFFFKLRGSVEVGGIPDMDESLEGFRNLLTPEWNNSVLLKRTEAGRKEVAFRINLWPKSEPASQVQGQGDLA